MRERCPEDRGVATSLRTGVTHEYDHDQPTTPAHDGGHECAQARTAFAAEPYLQLQAVRCVPEALSRYGHDRGHPPVPAVSGRKRDEHLQSQPDHDWAQVSLPRDAQAAG